MSGPTIDYRPPADDDESAGAKAERRAFLRAFAAIAVAGVLLIVSIVVVLVIESRRVRKQMEKADAHILTVRPQIAGDPRFKDVRLLSETRGGGSILVYGCVDSAADLAALRQIVDNSGPPVPVDWHCEDLSKRTAPAIVTSTRSGP